MTWTMIHCHFPTFETEEEVHAYLEEKQAKYAAKVAEREQYITILEHRG